MDTHLSAEDIKNYRARKLSAEELDKLDDHVHSCATCYQDFLAELQKRFPIEFDLDELTGMQGWHLEGEELAAYVEGRMDELDFECAVFHLEECDSCLAKVSVASERQLTSPRLNMRSMSRQSARWGGRLPVLRSVSRPRLQLARGAALLLALALIVWAVVQFRPAQPQVVDIVPRQPPSVEPFPQQPNVPPPEPPSGAGDGIAVDGTRQQKRPVPAPSEKRAAGQPEGEIERALIAQDLVMPTAIERLDKTLAIAVRGSGASVQSFTIVRPFATVISTDRPTFRWTSLSGATSYTVSVYDTDLHLVTESKPLTETQWSMSDRLKAGIVYTWMVTALKDGQEIYAPTPPARAEFKILITSELTKLNRRLRRTVSNAARGVLYAEVGLLDEAEGEFQTHLSLQPGDERAKKLFETIKSWRGIEP